MDATLGVIAESNETREILSSNEESSLKAKPCHDTEIGTLSMTKAFSGSKEFDRCLELALKSSLFSSLWILFIIIDEVTVMT